jgi:hypothetical protein
MQKNVKRNEISKREAPMFIVASPKVGGVQLVRLEPIRTSPHTVSGLFVPHLVRSKKCLELQLASTTNRTLLISNAQFFRITAADTAKLSPNNLPSELYRVVTCANDLLSTARFEAGDRVRR